MNNLTDQPMVDASFKMCMYNAKVDWIKYIWKVIRNHIIWVQMKLFQSSQDCLKTISVLLQKIISISKEEAFVFLSLLRIALTYLESLIIFIVQITFCLLEEFKLIHV